LFQEKARENIKEAKMHLSVRTGSVNLDLKDEEKEVLSLSVSDYGGCDCGSRIGQGPIGYTHFGPHRFQERPDPEPKK
jgi:hypothetical protein